MNAFQNFFTLTKTKCFSSLNLFSSTHVHQQRFMSKYLSKSAKKRLNLSPKRAHKGFYKGKGSTKEGRLTSKGKFIVNPLRRLELVVPDLTGFKVRVNFLCTY